MRLVTPGRDSSIEIADSSLPSYLSEHGLTSVRSGTAATLVVFPQSAEGLVLRAISGDLPRVQYRGLKQFPHDLEEALGKDEVVCLVGDKHLVREFFGTEGFCRLMREITSHVADAELAVPPGAYLDHKHVAVWRRLSSKPGS